MSSSTVDAFLQQLDSDPNLSQITRTRSKSTPAKAKTLILQINDQIQHVLQILEKSKQSLDPHRPINPDPPEVKIPIEDPVLRNLVCQFFIGRGYTAYTTKNRGEQNILVIDLRDEDPPAVKTKNDTETEEKRTDIGDLKQYTTTKDSVGLQHASEALRKTKEFVLAAVKVDGQSLQYASEELRKNKEIVLAAVQQNGEALQYASEEMKNDKEIVLAAVVQNGEALEFASKELKNDTQIVLIAVKVDGQVLRFASPELQNLVKMSS